MDLPRAALAAWVLLVSAAAAQAGHGCACEAYCDQACGCESACDAACGGEACGGCDCLECCDWNCGPVWEVRASYLYLKRDSLDSVNLMNDFGGMELLNGDDFQFDNQSGMDLSGIYHYGCGRSIEARYVWIDDWQDTVNGQFFGGSISTTPPSLARGFSNFAATYRSEFQSGEINLRRTTCCGTVALFAGFRYIEINESLDMVFPNFIESLFWRTQNDLYGFQLGAEALLWENCSGWRVQGSARAGVYYNDAKSSFNFVDRSSPVGFANAEEHEAAFAGEAELLAEYQLNCTWSVHAGYRVMLIDGLALAPNQVPATGRIMFGKIPSTLDMDGTLLAHGLVAGVDAAW